MDTKTQRNTQRIPKEARSPARTPKRFTVTNLASLPPGTYTDPAAVGLQLRVTARAKGKETRSWLLRFKFQGNESRLLLGHFPALSLADARIAAQNLRERAAQGIDPRQASARRIAIRTTPNAPTSPYTVATLASEFLERHVRPHRKKPEYVEQILSRDVLPNWGRRDARTIAPHEVITLLDRIVARGSPVQANRVAGVLSQMFRFGIHRQIVADSPVKLLFRPGGQESPRRRVLTADELRILVTAPQRVLRLHRTAHIAMILLLTGQRRGELVKAEWRNIDFKAALWRIPAPDAKNGREHVVPLSALALEEFSALRRLSGRSRFVLPTESGNSPIDPKLVTRSFARCVERTKDMGINPFTLHDLRRTCRTGLAMLGVPRDIAERVLNHAQDRLIATYDVYEYLNEKRNALNLWSLHIKKIRDGVTNEITRN